MTAVTPRWMWQNFIQLSNTLVFASSELLNFPSSWLRDSLRSKRWRSKTGWVIMSGYNDTFDFQEDATPRVATLTEGVYDTGDDVAMELQTQMNAVGSNVYSVTYSAITFKFTISRTSGSATISLLHSTGSNKTKSCSLEFGFDDSADDTGLTTYVADNEAYQSRHLIWFDLGTAFESKSAILAFSNLDPTDSVNVMGNTTNSFIAPSFEQALVYGATRNLFAKQFVGQSYRWWAFEIHAVQNSDGYVEVGIPFIGSYTQLTVGYFRDYSEGREELSTIEVSDQGAHFQNIRPTRKQYNVQWPGVPTPDKTALESIVEFVKVGRSFFFAMDVNSVDGDETNILYTFLASGITFTSIGNGYWSASFVLNEALG